MEERPNTVAGEVPVSVVSTDSSLESNRSVNECVSYEDGDGLVICDRTNAKAWIRSDVVTALSS